MQTKIPEFIQGIFGFVETTRYSNYVSNTKEPYVYLIRRADTPFAGCWSLPGGRMVKRERMTETCIREVREETGLQVITREFLARARFTGDDSKFYEAHCFKCEINEKNVIKREISKLKKEVLNTTLLNYKEQKSDELKGYKIAPPIWALIKELNSGKKPPYEISLIK